MAGSLLACAIIRALENANYENQYDNERHENAAKMEHIACKLLQEYNKQSEEVAYHALLHEVPALGDRNCLDLARSAGAKSFATQAAFKSLVDRFWYGGIEGPTMRLWFILFSLPIITLPIFLWIFPFEMIKLEKYLNLLV